MNYKISKQIRWVLIGSSIVLLDIRTGCYLGLSEDAAKQWLGILKESDDHSINTYDFNNSNNTLDNGKTAIAAFLEAGLLDIPNEVACADGIKTGIKRYRSSILSKVPNVLVALYYIYIATWLVKHERFHDIYYRLQGVDSGTCNIPLPKFETALSYFLHAETLFPFGSSNRDCLARSTALYLYMRYKGYSVKHNIGVRMDPFAAHAWVSHHGSPVLNDQAQMLQYYVILSSPENAQ